MKRFFIFLIMSMASIAVFAQEMSQELTFHEIDSLWKITPFLKNEAPLSYMEYGNGDDLSGGIWYFSNNAGKYKITMCVVGMPREMGSQRVSMQLMVGGFPVIIPEEVAYQVYDDPKLIGEKIVIRSHVGVDLRGDYFYTVIGGIVPSHYGHVYYFTKTSAQLEYEKEQRQ